MGLKLTMAPFALGLALGTLALAGRIGNRLQRLAALGVGGLAGAALFGGQWAYQLWLTTGNPFFPYFNDLIGSPLLLEASYRDPRFLPRSGVEALLYPFLFSQDPTRVSDVPFRDVKLMLAYMIVPGTLLWSWLTRRAHLTQATRFLFVVALVSYAVWLPLFGLYRYVVTLEMLAPLLIILALSLWPFAERQRWAALAVLWGLALLGTGWSSITAPGRSWREGYVAVTVPDIADPARTLVLMAGLEPMGYIVPAFPPQVAFLRIDGWLDTPSSHSLFGDRMRARIAGPRRTGLRCLQCPRREAGPGCLRGGRPRARHGGLLGGALEYRRSTGQVRPASAAPNWHQGFPAVTIGDINFRSKQRVLRCKRPRYPGFSPSLCWAPCWAPARPAPR